MRRHRKVLTIALSLVFLLALGASPPRAANDPESMIGQSATLLPDGRWLLLGGSGQQGVVAEAILRDLQTSTMTPLPQGLQHARAEHTATVLSSGEILVFGGIDGASRVIAKPELLGPGTFVSVPLVARGISPRAFHSATLLLDGRVLLAGGVDDRGRVLDTLELWDPRTRLTTQMPVRLKRGRYRHEAALLADGSVLFWGGVDLEEKPLAEGERYSPRVRALSPAKALEDDPATAYLADSEPANGASDVPVDAVIGLRFSRRVRVQSVDGETVNLNGPAGPVAARVVAAEEGRLAFLTPQEPLSPGVTYTLSFSGLTDRQGTTFPATEIKFSTASAPGLESGDSQDQTEDPSWRTLPPLQATSGVTALAGQVLRLNGRPLVGATLEIGKRKARSDSTGRFLLAPLPAGWHELTIDGRTASQTGATYGVFEVRVEVFKGVTTALPFTIWMPKLDTAHRVAIPSPTTAEVVVTTPGIPGLEIHIPPGSVLRDHDWNVATEVSITPIPVDRPPFPLPEGVQVPIYYTVQPGGGYVKSAGGKPSGVRIIYPNYMHSPPGTRVDFWHYDPEDRGWYVYGQGTVDNAGRQVVPDPGVIVYELTGAMINVPGYSPPPLGPAPGADAQDGDPVDLGTGLFVMSKTDLTLPDVLPLVLTRTYRPRDSVSRPFGLGTTHPYEVFLWSAKQYTEADLILPDGSRVHYVRTSPGTGFTNAVFEHTATPTVYQKSNIRWVSGVGGWELKLKDGSSMFFGELSPLYAIRDRYGNEVRIERASTSSSGFPIGNITRIVSQNGRWIQFAYDRRSRITRAEDNIGRVVSYAYDTSGRLTRVTDPVGRTTEYTYDSANRMTQIKDAKGIIFLINQYDVSGRVIQQKQADGSIFRFSYTLDAKGRITRTDVTDPRGNVRRVSFNAVGYPIQDTFAAGKHEEKTLLYARNHITQLVQSVTDSLKRKTVYQYDEMGDVSDVTRLAGTAAAATTRFAYDSPFSPDLVTSITDPLGHTTTIDYASPGVPYEVKNPLGQLVLRLSHGSDGQLLSSTSGGGTAHYSYDFGDLVAATDPLGAQVRRFVDAAGRLGRVTDPHGYSTRYEYDALNQLTKITDPLGGITAFSYDPNGNLLAVTDARKNTIRYTYDLMDRLASRTDSLGRREIYRYDLSGNLVQTTDRKGQVTQSSYDALNRLTHVAYADGSSTTYTYDRGDRLIQITDSQSGSISFTYDGFDRLIMETSPLGTISYTYDAAGRRTGMTVDGEVPVTYSYDNADRLTSVVQGSLTAVLSYDYPGRRESLKLSNGVRATYEYDAASRLTWIGYGTDQAALGNLTYEYDAAGNRLKVGGTLSHVDLPQSLPAASYDAANQLANWGTSSLTYDANGNQISDGVRTYRWNARDQLVEIGGPIPATFQYDALGRRASKIVAGTRTEFLYDGAEVVQERSGTSAPTNLFLGPRIDEVFARSQGTDLQVLLSDALRSTVALSSGGGALRAQYSYEPFGRTSAIGDNGKNPTQFTGRENDGTGIFYYRARYYDPVAGRFVSEDPIGFAGGNVNLYGYAHNNPTNLVDPFGFQDNASPWQVGWEWLTGRGSRVHHFQDGDPFTESLRRHGHIRNLMNRVCNGTLPQNGRFNYELKGLQGAPKYIKDYSTLMTGGLTGNLAVTYLGSYDLSYSVTGEILSISVWNTSSIASATHPPVIGYTDWWNAHIGAPMNNLFLMGPMSATEQYFDFHENLAGRGCGCQ